MVTLIQIAHSTDALCISANNAHGLLVGGYVEGFDHEDSTPTLTC